MFTILNTKNYYLFKNNFIENLILIVLKYKVSAFLDMKSSKSQYQISRIVITIV